MRPTRRLVLKGAGGFTLGLPFLPSLVTPSLARAQSTTRRPRFVAITTEHGGISGENMYPAATTLTTRTPLFPGHEINSGRLLRQTDGTSAWLSPVLRAPASRLTARLVDKMNLLRGLDIPFYIGHHTGGHLGNYARNDGNGSDGKMMQAFPWPTIDQHMAWSPSFYRDLGGIRERALVTGTRGGFSWNWSNPSARTGAVQEVRSEPSSLTMFNRIFVAPQQPGMDPRKPIVDRVIDNYRSLRAGRRISALDRQRLDDHLDRLNELQRRLTVTRPLACGNLTRPTQDAVSLGYSYDNPEKSRQRFLLLVDVIVAAFMCGTSRIAVLNVADTFAPFTGDWHQDVAHKAPTTGQTKLVEGLRNTFVEVVLDLLNKLDVEETPGTTYLDNSLVQWTQESGVETHDAASIPVLTAGSAAGFFKTGLFVDYRNLAPKGRLFEHGVYHDNAGLTYNRWLATVLLAMGIPRSEFERNGVPGYGHPFVSAVYNASHAPGVTTSAGEVVPLIAA